MTDSNNKRNMGKKILNKLVLYSSLFILHSSLLLVSCSLDEQPLDQITEEEAYTSGTDLFRNTVATLYSYVGGSTDGQGLQGTCRGVYDLQTFGSDEAMIPTRGNDWYDGGIWQALYRHSWNGGHEMIKNSWLYLYKVITLCNRSLYLLDKHRQLLDADELEYCNTEVRALRAIYYWYLLDLFGDVPLITSYDVSIKDVTQASRQEVFDFVVRELSEAADELSLENSTKRGDFYGRITAPVAYFVLAKLMLNAEVYTGTPQWEEAIEYCDAIEGLGYRLEPLYATNFKIYNEVSSENIFTIPMDRDLYSNQMQYIYRSLHYRHAAANGFVGENGTCATLKALQVFGYNTDNPDSRFYQCYWADTVLNMYGKTVTDRSGEPLVYHPWEVRLDLSGSPYVETAGARMRKYETDWNAAKDGKLMDNDIVLFRFADVLLMRAEAKLRSGQDGQADFDAVRDRAVMPLRQLNLENLLDERLLELAWEGWRRQDLIRFGKYESLYDGPDKVDESDGHTSLFPIPNDAKTLNQNLKQNDGY